MERKDFRKTGSYSYGAHDEGNQRTDESTVEFRGHIAEADLIVKALTVYVALEKALAVMGMQTEPDRMMPLNEKPKIYASDLLAQIARPNYPNE